MFFAVQLSGGANVDSGNIIPFDTEKSNFGAGFNVASHKFAAPFNGTYEFNLQIMTSEATKARAEVTVKGQDECRAHTGPGMYT